MSDDIQVISNIKTGSRRLYDINFTDLNFSEQGEAFLKNVDGEEEPIVGVPEAVLADLHILHRRVCDRGQNEIEFFIDYDDMRFRVSRIDSVGGRWFTLNRTMFPIPRIASLKGIPKKVIHYLGHIAKPPDGHGLIIVSGSTGAGKTTTACSLLREYLLTYGDVAVTVEDPPEMHLDGAHGKSGHCYQTQAPNGDFGEAMRLTMRRRPRYILLGEIRGPTEANAAIRAGMNGHMVITTIHAGSCIEALNSVLKLMETDGESLKLAQNMLAGGLAGVLNQKLVKVNGKRQIKMEFLFPGGNSNGIRALIRSGKTEQLTTAIASQASRVLQDKLPLEEFEE